MDQGGLEMEFYSPRSTIKEGDVVLGKMSEPLKVSYALLKMRQIYRGVFRPDEFSRLMEKRFRERLVSDFPELGQVPDSRIKICKGWRVALKQN